MPLDEGYKAVVQKRAAVSGKRKQQMAQEHELRFGPLRLDVTSQRLCRVRQALRWRPKSFAVLAYLVQRHGQLVTKDEILEALWPGLAVTEGFDTADLREARALLEALA